MTTGRVLQRLFLAAAWRLAVVGCKAFLLRSTAVTRSTGHTTSLVTTAHFYYPRLFHCKDIFRSSAIHDDGNEGDPSQLSTSQLLEALNRRQIRYAPRSTRAQLEALLVRAIHDELDAKPAKSPAHRQHDATMSSPKTSSFYNVESPPPTAAPFEAIRLTTREIVEELLARGIRLPPHASRSELEQLLLRENAPSNISDAATSSTSPRQRRKRPRRHVALSRILTELDELGIAYPPQASPATLERLLREHDESSVSPPPPQRRRKPSRNAATSSRSYFEEVKIDTGRQPRERSKQMAELLQELDDRGIRYRPGMNRAELEQLLQTSVDGIRKDFTSEIYSPTRKGPSPLNGNNERGNNARSKDIHSDEDESSVSFTTGNGSRKRKMHTNRSVWSKLYNKSRATVSSGIFETIPNYFSSVAEQAARKARYLKRRAADFIMEDENGIRDVDYTYVRKDDRINQQLIDVTATRLVEEDNDPYTTSDKAYQYTDFQPASEFRTSGSKTNHRRPSSRGNPSTGSYRPNKKPPIAHPPTRRRYQAGAKKSPVSRQNGGSLQMPRRNAAAQSPLFYLPPAESDFSSTDQAHGHRASGSKRSKGTRPSSRYPEGENASRRVYSPYDIDGTPSDAYRDSIDKLGEFFARATDTLLWGCDGDEEVVNSKPHNTERHQQARTSPTSRTRKSWKDRLEERMDAMLGLNEDGKYYNRWAVQEEAEDAVSGTDAYSVAQGRGPKRRHRPKFYKDPFWERHRFVRILFGKSPASEFNNVFGGGSESTLLQLLKLSTKSLVMLAAFACEWASVRDSLPQPAVVVIATSCTLCARRGQRLLALAVSLVLLRIVGELMHESLYGDEDWEDDEDERDEAAIPTQL